MFSGLMSRWMNPCRCAWPSAARDFSRKAQGFIQRQRRLALEPCAQRPAFHVRHDVVQLIASSARVEERQDVRVHELGRDLDLAQEAHDPDRGGDLRLQDFDRDPSAMLQVLREKHRRHAAAAQQALDPVAPQNRAWPRDSVDAFSGWRDRFRERFAGG